MTVEQGQKARIATWEEAELERSAHEAASVDRESLVITDLDRYSSPRPTTVYPLEYSCCLLGNLQNRVAFDYGCGTGENTVLLANRGAKVVALDISPELIEIAKRRLEVNRVSAEDVRFIVGSAYETTLADESVDVVFGIGILHHLDLTLAQREVYRILRRGGYAIFQEPVRDSRLLRLVRRLIPYRSPDVSPFERPLTSRELTAFASAFQHAELRSFALPHVSLVGVVLPRLIHHAYALDGALLRTLPFLGKYGSIRVLKVTK